MPDSAAYHKAYYRKWRKTARGRALRNADKRLARTGWTDRAFQSALLDQQNRCAICQTEMTHPQADHDHATGERRDVLCRVCNLTLGLMKDDPHRLRAAADYLEKHV